MKVVIDTNIIISGLINPDGIPAGIVNLIFNQKITVLYDNRILNEYKDVLKREKFGFSLEIINNFLEFIKFDGQYITAIPTNKKFSDLDDKPFYEVALTGHADYLITGNIRHFPKKGKGFQVLNPQNFIEKYYNKSN